MKVRLFYIDKLIKKMKIKQKVLVAIWICLFVFSVYKCNSQDKISLGFYQDVKLALKSDDYGNKPFTRDLLIRLNMQGDQQFVGYMVMFPELETANLHGGLYTRWSVNSGYVLNNLILDNFEIGATIGIGMIHRESSTLSFGSGLMLSYRFNRIKFVSIYQITQRSDIDKIKNSVFAGVEITLN